jgi:hypothetical protein
MGKHFKSYNFKGRNYVEDPEVRGKAVLKYSYSTVTNRLWRCDVDDLKWGLAFDFCFDGNGHSGCIMVGSD